MAARGVGIIAVTAAATATATAAAAAAADALVTMAITAASFAIRAAGVTVATRTTAVAATAASAPATAAVVVIAFWLAVILPAIKVIAAAASHSRTPPHHKRIGALYATEPALHAVRDDLVLSVHLTARASTCALPQLRQKRDVHAKRRSVAPLATFQPFHLAAARDCQPRIIG